MNDCNQFSELTKEQLREFREFLNEVYGYAADLYIKQGKNWSEVEQELVKWGLSEENASVVVSNLREGTGT